jgi:hypothetical protein
VQTSSYVHLILFECLNNGVVDHNGRVLTYWENHEKRPSDYPVSNLFILRRDTSDYSRNKNVAITMARSVYPIIRNFCKSHWAPIGHTPGWWSRRRRCLQNILPRNYLLLRTPPNLRHLHSNPSLSVSSSKQNTRTVRIPTATDSTSSTDYSNTAMRLTKSWHCYCVAGGIQRCKYS